MNTKCASQDYIKRVTESSNVTDKQIEVPSSLYIKKDGMEWAIQFSSEDELRLIQEAIKNFNKIPMFGHDMELVAIKCWDHCMYALLENGGLYGGITDKLKIMLLGYDIFDRYSYPRELRECTDFIWKWNDNSDPVIALKKVYNPYGSSSEDEE
jgi:hypothetical protein